eukprot:scaffold27177_cov31-Phaeocystis_antarctica.AAC.1
MPSGKDAHQSSPWLEAIAGIRERPYPRLDSKPVPAPRTRSEVRASLRRVLTAATATCSRSSVGVRRALLHLPAFGFGQPPAAKLDVCGRSFGAGLGPMVDKNLAYTNSDA